MMEVDTDPWLWSVSDVCDFFTKSAATYLRDRPNAKLPDPASFTELLKANDIDGPTLLTDVDPNALRSDFGLSSLGQRSAVFECIRRLREFSTRGFNVRSESASARSNDPTQQPINLPKIQEHAPPEDEAANGPVRIGAEAQSVNNKEEPKNPTPHTSEERTQGGPPANNDIRKEVHTPPPYTPGEHVRERETQVTDERGRKRRKLDLTASKAVPPNDHAIAHGSFLSARPHDVDEMFYGLQSFGKLPDDELLPAHVGIHGDDAELRDTNFTFHGPALITDGGVQVIWSHLHYFLNAGTEGEYRLDDTTSQTDSTSPLLAIRPYRTNSWQKQPQSVTVFRKSHDGIQAYRERADLLDNGFSQYQEYQHAGALTDEDTRLMEKYGHTDEVIEWETLSLDGNSDEIESRTPNSSDDDLASVDETDEQSEQISREDALAIIDANIAHFRDEKEAKLLRSEPKKAFSIWRRGNGSVFARQSLVAGAKALVTKYSMTLEKIKAVLLEDLHRSKAAFETACQVLEPTVTQMAEEEWKVSIWQRKVAPEKPARTADGKRTTLQSRHGLMSVETGFDAPGDTSFIEEDMDEEHFVDEEQAELDLNHRDTQVPVTPEDDIMTEDQPTMDCSGEEADAASVQELLSPSTFVPSSRTVILESRPKLVNAERPSSDSDIPNRHHSSPEKLPTPATTTPPRPTGHFMSSKSEEIRSWDLSQLFSWSDRGRLLLKLLHEDGEVFRNELYDYLKSLTPSEFREKLELSMVASAYSRVHETHNVKSSALIDRTGTLAAVWITAKPDALKTGPVRQIAFQQALKEGSSQLSTFYSHLRSMLEMKRTRLFQDLVIVSSDDDAPQIVELQESPRKKKKIKKAKPRDRTAEQTRLIALERQAEYQEALQTQVHPSHTNEDHDGAEGEGVIVNPVRVQKGGSPIYIPAGIAKHMKPHQVEGVRFLWREMTLDDDEEAPRPQGCILAHAMGLGKTLQTIAFLATVAHTAKSPDRKIRRQLPKRLRRSKNPDAMPRVVVLSPPGLRQNWTREIETWSQGRLGNVTSIESGAKMDPSRVALWDDVGGVMLIGYQVFRDLVNKPLHNDNDVRQTLLERTDIVVADEAHNLKNATSGISRATAQFKTESRIALTGTPMSNDIPEIYSLVSWVAPGYLGPADEFNDHFSRPIKEGLFEDSLPQQKRKSLKRLQGLRSEIGPKVNRADTTVLKDQLPGKIEFNIEVALTKEQEQLYLKAGSFLKGSEAYSKKILGFAQIFAYLAVFMLLTNHPSAFSKKLRSPPPPKTKQKRSLLQPDCGVTESVDSGKNSPLSPMPVEDNDSEDLDPDFEDTYALGFTKPVVEEILDGVSENIDPNRSAKSALLLDIVRHSMEVGDRVLVFSRSIPTLAYLRDMLENQNITQTCIDGGTPMPKRTTILDRFQAGEFHVLLVSTRAGGVGLNIQCANRVVIFDYEFNPMWEEQAIGRSYRLGQTKRVYVYRFIAGGTFETALYNRQLFKTSLTHRVVDDKNPKRHAVRRAFELFNDPSPVPQQEIAIWASKDPAVLGRIIDTHGDPHEPGKRDTRIRNITTMETLNADADDEPLTAQEQEEVKLEIKNRLTNKISRQSGIGIPAPPPPQIPPPSSAPVIRTAVMTAPPPLELLRPVASSMPHSGK